MLSATGLVSLALGYLQKSGFRVLRKLQYPLFRYFVLVVSAMTSSRSDAKKSSGNVQSMEHPAYPEVLRLLHRTSRELPSTPSPPR